MALLLAGCAPEVRRDVDVKDPLAVAIYDEKGRPLFPEGTAGESRTAGLAMARDARGQVTLGDRVVLDARGHGEVTMPANRRPALGEPSLDGASVWLPYPYFGGSRRYEVTRVWLETPLANVRRIHETRTPRITGAAFVVGAVLGGAGGWLLYDGLFAPNKPGGERGGQIALSSLVFAMGLMMVSIDVYGMVAPSTDRVLYEAR